MKSPYQKLLSLCYSLSADLVIRAVQSATSKRAFLSLISLHQPSGSNYSPRQQQQQHRKLGNRSTVDISPARSIILLSGRVELRDTQSTVAISIRLSADSPRRKGRESSLLLTQHEAIIRPHTHGNNRLKTTLAPRSAPHTQKGKWCDDSTAAVALVIRLVSAIITIHGQTLSHFQSFQGN